MARIYIGGAGGTPSNNVIRSLRESSRRDHLIGASSVLTDLIVADVDERHLVLPAVDEDYPHHILRVFSKTKPAFVHMQHDFEVRAVSRLRSRVADAGIRLFLPDCQTVENCVDKFRSYQIWHAAGLRVPDTMLLGSAEDLTRAFKDLGDTVWIRSTEGGGAFGALPTDNIDFARIWIDRFDGWGRFTASRLLTGQSVTWLSIWFEGELVVAQGRKRWKWNYGNRTLSGVTGITGVAETVSDPIVDRAAQDAILSMDARPHGIFGVDMTYDAEGRPNLTEINIGRFFTTVYFFTKAGLNMPEIYADIALEEKFPLLETKINPLPSGLLWIRGMDVDPVLTTVGELERAQREWAE